MTARTPPADRSFRKVAILFAIVFVGGAMLMGSAWQALAAPGGGVNALTHPTCSAFPDAVNGPSEARYTQSCTTLPDFISTTYSTVTVPTTTTESTKTETTKPTKTETTKTETKTTTTSKATTTSRATTTSTAVAPPVAQSTITGAQQKATPSTRTAGPIPRAVNAGQNEASSWPLAVGGALITLGALGAALSLRRPTTER